MLAAKRKGLESPQEAGQNDRLYSYAVVLADKQMFEAVVPKRQQEKTNLNIILWILGAGIFAFVAGILIVGGLALVLRRQNHNSPELKFTK